MSETPQNVGEKLAQHDSEIRSQGRALAKLDQDLKEYGKRTQEGFENVFRKLDVMASSSKPDTKWMIMAFFGGTGLLFTGTQMMLALTLNPIKESQGFNRANVEAIREAQRQSDIESSYSKGKREALQDELYYMREQVNKLRDSK